MIWLLGALALAAAAGALVLWNARVARSVEARVPPAGRFVEVPGARLHLVERGSGPPLLMVHGLAGQLGHFTYALVDRLATRFRVIAVDRPGSGYSLRARDTAASLGAQADALAALIDALGLERPLVVGHSLGGAVALALAQRHPAKVGALALLAPLAHAPRALPPMFNGLLLQHHGLRRALAWTLALPLLMLVRERRLRSVFAPDAVPVDYGTRGGGLLVLRPDHFAAASADLAATPADLPALAAGFAAMRLPVTILYGRGDRVLDPREQGEALAAALPGARLTLIDGGHMLPLTAPQACEQCILEAAALAVGAPAHRPS